MCKEGVTCGEHCCKKGRDLLEREMLPEGQGELRRRGMLQEQRIVLWWGLLHGARETCVGGAKGKQCCVPSRISGSGASATLLPGGHGRDGVRVLPAEQPRLL